jgi:hypothetical protein
MSVRHRFLTVITAKICSHYSEQSILKHIAPLEEVSQIEKFILSYADRRYAWDHIYIVE